MEAKVEGSVTVPGTVVQDVIVEAGSPWGRIVKQGQHLRIIDLEGRQAVDFLCYDAADPGDRYNAANTMKLGANIFVTKGSVLWSDRAKKMMAVLEDTCGYHDTLGGCCSSEMNLLRYNKTPPRNCRDTFEEALKKLGMTKSKTIERDDGGSIDITTAIATPGSSTLPMSSISTCASSPL